MGRRIIVLLVMFLVFPYFVYSITTFVIQETDKLSLRTNATDPDRDKLTIGYTPPLNQNGEWQTSYGDAGNYKSSIVVSDGITNITQEIFIVVKRKEESPKIEIYSPAEEPVKTKEGQSIKFYADASDLNNDQLIYTWLLDGNKLAQGQDFYYTPPYNHAGTHKVSVAATDGLFTAKKEWNVEVEDVDLQKLLDNIPDVTLNENEIARLTLPDFSAYSLKYTISDPIGNNNEWHTNYDDAGSYHVKVHAEGNGFSGNKDVKVTVNNVDRVPVFEKLENEVVDENNTVKIILNAVDPDGDPVVYSVEKLPKGAQLDGNVFTWVPDFDTVKKEDIIDRIVEKFTVLSKNFYVQFKATSKGKAVVQNVVMTVKDSNRPPVLEDLQPITVKEPDTIKILPNAHDPDGDKISLRYSGFMTTDTYKTNYGNSGNYTVKVTASDGNLETSKIVQIKILKTNRAPIFNKIPDRKSTENDTITILLDAKDPDNDQLAYSVINSPEGSAMKDNVFFWTPGFNIVNRKETKKFDLVFAVTDGQAEAKQIAHLEISNKNRAPRIINSSNSIVGDMNRPVFMFVKVVDDDGDKLSYIWDFGFLDAFTGTDKHQRTFTAPGQKTARVTVSDGIDNTEKTINVFVRGNQTAANADVSVVKNVIVQTKTYT